MSSSDEHEEALLKAMKQSHAAIDDAVREHVSTIGATGVTTGWLLLVAITDFEEGDELDGMFATSSDGMSKWAKTGLLAVALHQEKTEGYQ